MNRDRMDQLSRLFDDAYDEIDTEGWARQESNPSSGPCCVSHALVRVAIRTGRQYLVQSALRIFADHVGAKAPYTNATPAACVVRWNDKQKTSYVVLRALEAIADRYRPEAQEPIIGGW